MRSGVRRVVLLTLGWEDLSRSVSVHGAPLEQRLREPTPEAPLQTDGGWLLLDTGFNTALVRDPALRRRFYPDAEYLPVLPGDGEPLHDALDRAGVPVDRIDLVALSHLHLDHVGGLRLFDGRVPVHAQRRELEYGLSGHPEPERNGIFRVDFDDPRIPWRLADGDADIAPGVRAVSDARGTLPVIRASSSSWTTASGAAGTCSRSTRPTSPRTSRTSCRSARSSGCRRRTPSSRSARP